MRSMTRLYSSSSEATIQHIHHRQLSMILTCHLQDPTRLMSPSDSSLVLKQAPAADHEQSGHGQSARSAGLEQLLW